MNAVSVPDQTMTSRDIAEIAGKEHRNVMRDIRAMLVELHGEGGMLRFEHTLRNEQNGQSYPIYRLPKRETLILISGYSVELRAKIIDRWQELEAARAAPAPPPAELPPRWPPLDKLQKAIVNTVTAAGDETPEKYVFDVLSDQFLATSVQTALRKLAEDGVLVRIPGSAHKPTRYKLALQYSTMVADQRDQRETPQALPRTLTYGDLTELVSFAVQIEREHPLPGVHWVNGVMSVNVEARSIDDADRIIASIRGLKKLWPKIVSS
jgi:Rha family phage regulatory protein